MSGVETQQLSGELSGHTFGPYKIGALLGQGGMAAVYLAQQPSIGRSIAIKIMPAQTMHNRGFLERFEREAKVAASLQHPRIIPIYDYGTAENRPYIVMAYIPGGTLADRIAEGPLSVEECVRLVRQMGQGLDFAHRKGVIHRDFKPSNVLLDEEGNAHLADFGIARLTESNSNLTGSGVVGTPAYIAPEMVDGRPVTAAVDIYALGVTLFEMLTGEHPFSADTPLRVMMAHASAPIPDVRIWRSDLPEGVTTVIERAMAKNPVDRYETAGALAKSLAEAAEGKPITKPNFTDFSPYTLAVGRPARKRNLWFLVGGTAALVILAAAMVISGLPALKSSSVQPTTPPELVGIEPSAAQSLSPTPEVTPSPNLPFPPAAENEVLVIVTDFVQEGVAADTRIYQSLAEQVASSKLDGVRVERLQGVKPLLAEDAVAVGNQYGATLVIWGTADTISLEPHYEVVRNLDKIATRIPQVGTSSASDSASYSVYVSQSAPKEFDYLMLYLLGQIAMSDDQPQKAVDLLGDAVAIDLGDRGQALNLAGAYLLRCGAYRKLGQANQDVNQFQLALNDCTKAIDLDPDSIPNFYRRGLVYADLGNDDAALADMNVFYPVFKHTLHYDYLTHASVFILQGEISMARIFVEHSVDPASTSSTEYLDRAAAWYDLGEWGNALADFDTASSLQPDSAYNGVIMYYPKYINFDPVTYYRSDIEYRLGHTDEAVADINAVIEVRGSADDYIARANLYAQMATNLDQALDDANRVITTEKRSETLSRCYDTRALIYYKMGNYAAALADIQQAIDLYNSRSASTIPRNVVFFYHRALIYEAQGENDKAIADYQDFLQRDHYVVQADEMAHARERIIALGGTVP